MPLESFMVLFQWNSKIVILKDIYTALFCTSTVQGSHGCQENERKCNYYSLIIFHVRIQNPIF